jgi:hypothetical protein
MLLSALGRYSGCDRGGAPGRAATARALMPSRARVRSGRRREARSRRPVLECANDGDWHAQQLKGRVHPVEQNNTDDAEQQDGKGE